jgi:hypothetical protein
VRIGFSRSMPKPKLGRRYTDFIVRCSPAGTRFTACRTAVLQTPTCTQLPQLQRVIQPLFFICAASVNCWSHNALAS